ncbi:MAG: amidase [Deltaproteobacteria bacterium RBG_13_43_22]|nr:MAG: amidase [Deltaproteobacteria bacterium RBG_13_43_22]
MKGYERLAFMDATALAGLIRKKEIKAEELIEFTIRRIEKINPQINAVVTPMFDEARQAARGPIPKGPFAGVPFLIKDLLASYQGVRMTFGTNNLQHYIADHDSELVRRYKKAGFITVGKTNTPELGLLPTTESRLLGPCRNPWNLNRTTGGSSGGSAAAVASGLVPVAHGNDGGGSIRIPASCCGLFGLKPTRARNPLGPDFGDLMNGFVAEHVLTRSVRDSAAILDATMGVDVGDPYCAPLPIRPLKKEIGKDPGRLRIAYWGQTFRGQAIAEDCQKALLDSVKLCSELGHDLIETSPTFDGEQLARAFTVIWATGCASTVEGISYITGKKPSPDQYEPVTWGLYEMGIKVSGSDYLFAVQSLQRISREWAGFLIDYDSFMTPTLGEPPVLLGTFDSPADDPLKGWRRSAQFVPFTPICNATGQPAMSVPLYWNDEGLPIGTHFMGRFGDEATLFRLAAQLEQARPWKDRRPPVLV